MPPALPPRHMPPDAPPPVTKDDIALLMEEIGKLSDANERWKQEVIEELDRRVAAHLAASEDRTKGSFDVVAEDPRHHFQGAFRDKLAQHEDRLGRLERRAGMA